MILFILIIISIVLSVFMYLIILGGAMNKTDYEEEIENFEQMNYLKNYNSKRRNKKDGRKNK